MVVFYFLLLPLTIVRHDSIFQLIALKLWSANTSSGNYSCRERHSFVSFPNVLRQLWCSSLIRLLTGFERSFFEKSFFARESEKVATPFPPDETLYQAWERFKELLMKCPQHYLPEIQEVILFYNGLDILTRQILNSRGAIPTMTAADGKKAIQEMTKYSQKWHNGTSRGRSTETSNGLAAIQEQLNNLGREIKKTNTSYIKTLKNSRPLPDFEEYAIDTPYMILWSKIKKNASSANTPYSKPQYSVLVNTPYPRKQIWHIGQYAVSKNRIRRTVFKDPPYLFDYPTKRLTKEEILAKFIDEVKGVTTRGGKMTSEATRSKEINETGININEPPGFEQDV
ncbi:hypothetical protein Tco_1352281 [Tanacetum coccineum]